MKILVAAVLVVLVGGGLASGQVLQPPPAPPSLLHVTVVARSSPNPTVATFEARYLEAPYSKTDRAIFTVTACTVDGCSAPAIFTPATNRVRIHVHPGILYWVEAELMGQKGLLLFQR